LLSFAIVIALLAAAPALAQKTTGSIRGTTVDADGQALPGVAIVVTGELLGAAQRTTVTSPDGGFMFAAMPIGTFRVMASLDGFQTQAAEEVRVAIGKVATVDFSMPEAFSEEISVTAETPLIDVASPTFNTRFDFEQVVDLPTRGNFYDLMAVTPGVNQPSEGSSSFTAYGSNMKNNQWNIDGVNRTLPDGGYLAWSINEEMVAEYQVLGTGATAEYGNMSGTAFNVVTKSGTNDFHGSVALDYQNPDWVDTNAESLEEDTPEEARTYRLERNDNLALTLGGPIVRDKLWFFVGAQWGRFKGFWPDQVELPESKEDSWDQYDAKITAQLGQNHRLNLTVNDHEELDPWLGNIWWETTAWTEWWAHNKMLALDYSAILGRNTILEARGGLWRGDEADRAQNPVDEPHVRDWTVYPYIATGGTYWTWEWEHHQDTAEVKITQHADNFIKGDHEFRFGVQYNKGGGTVLPFDLDYYYWYDYWGPDYVYYYKYNAIPFYYGAESETWSAFAADAWKISSELTLEIGVRYDTHKGWIPDYPRLDSDHNPTDNFDPRLGFAWNIGGDGKNVLRGSFGIFHANVVSGDWSYPPPEAPEPYWEWQYPGGDEWYYNWGYSIDDAVLVPGTENAEIWEYTLGFEHQLTATSAIGISGTYKKTENMIGWYIGGDGRFNWHTVIDDVTGEEIQLMDYYKQPTRSKGNSTGPGSNGGDRPYEQDYLGVFLTYKKRFSNNWDLMASYSYSESRGLNPRLFDGGLLGSQGSTFWASTSESDPNQYVKASSDKLLAGDRTHVFRVMGNVMLPYQFKLNSVVNIQTGRVYDRGQWFVLPESSGAELITNPGDDDQRLPTQYIWDFGVGKHFNLGRDTDFSIYLQILNILNDDAIEDWVTQLYTDGEDLVPGEWVLPRRAQIRLRFAF
jgi:hypothetical protein